MATFVLIAGAWHGAWCWERLTPLLQALGHSVLTPDLLGCGSDATPLAEISLAGWADQIAALIKAQAEPVVLVGHSRGGIVISEVAERVPEHITLLVYLTAFLLPTGETLQEAAGRSPQAPDDILTDHGDGVTRIRPEAIGRVFYNTTPSPWIERALERVGPEPMEVFVTPLSLSEDRYGSVPRVYIECLKDRAIPLTLQRGMQGRLPCDAVITLDSDHSPFYSDADALAESLFRLANDAPVRSKA